MAVIRNTKQRFAIRKIFEVENRPFTAEEIFELAQVTIPNIGLATVYRTLKEFQEEDFISSVELPGRTPSFERKIKKHRHHFVCRECDHTYPIEKCPGGFSKLIPEGFQLEDHALTLFGICRECHLPA
jgi:Fur family transcriptional regulator, ferric uptake regulator